jgi:hypothetical protein
MCLINYVAESHVGFRNLKDRNFLIVRNNLIAVSSTLLL